MILGLGKNVGRLVETDRYSAFCVQNIEVSLEIQRLTIKWPHWGGGGVGRSLGMMMEHYICMDAHTHRVVE